jgi:uncharacterized protein
MTVHESTDRRGMRVLTLDECVPLLRHVLIGRIGFLHHGEPEVLPVTFGMDGACPVFRTTWGSKLDVASGGGLVALEADEVDAARGRAWSVVVKGTALVDYDDKAIHRYEALDIPSWLRDGSETFWVRITPESVSGRELSLP